MTDPTLFLHAPLGQPGSGGVRYGAAMALWRAGRISAEVLEVYRIAAAHDGRDPAALLRERGLPVPVVLPPPTDDPLHRLYAASRAYLLGLVHPGAAEVRACLLPIPALRAGPRRAAPPSSTAGLPPRWRRQPTHQPALAAAIAAAAGQLRWVSYDAYPRADIGESFATGHACASIRGESAPFEAQDFDLGLFLVAPGVVYRDHCHAAPELYAPLTGPHGWRFGPEGPLTVLPAHQPVWNPPFKPHLTKVGAIPFLCLFVWTEAVNVPARVIPASDWPALEGTPLG